MTPIIYVVIDEDGTALWAFYNEESATDYRDEHYPSASVQRVDLN